MWQLNKLLIMNTVLFSVVVYFCYQNDNILVRADTVSNHRPIVGILSQEFYGEDFYLDQRYPDVNYSSYIAASYVKSVESSGARVVPILIGKSRSYYQELMRKINGVLFPGGDSCFNQTNGFGDAGRYIYEIAIELNDAGDYFPIHGTCLGFQLLIILASGCDEPENKINCNSHSNLPLNFTQDFQKSKMFERAPKEVIHLLATENITFHNHHFCIIDKNLISHNLTEDWRVTSHSFDDDGIPFISTVENSRYPFYGIQFHPEKISYEWNLSVKCPHSLSAVQVNRYFIDFFVSECKKNMHTFGSVDEENSYLIYNYEPHFTGAHGSIFEQLYLFEPNGTKPIKPNMDC